LLPAISSSWDREALHEEPRSNYYGFNNKPAPADSGQAAKVQGSKDSPSFFSPNQVIIFNLIVFEYNSLAPLRVIVSLRLNIFLISLTRVTHCNPHVAHFGWSTARSLDSFGSNKCHEKRYPPNRVPAVIVLHVRTKTHQDI
jgi:hypothetical protein